LTLTVKFCSRTNAMEYDMRMKGASIAVQKQQATCQDGEGCKPSRNVWFLRVH
jgi:hypothetical protein